MANFVNITNIRNLQPAKKLALWLLVSLALSLIFFQEFWGSLRTMLSLDWIFGQHYTAPLGVLGLCLIWLYLKRKEVWRGISLGSRPISIPLGLVLVAGAIVMPPSLDYLIFQMLLACLGVFVIFFGRGARIPSILLGIYGFAISFPLIIARFAADAYPRAAIVPLMGLMTTFGYPLQNQGQWVHFTSSSGESILVVITVACAGPGTMGFFLSIFALMMLDIPLPLKKAVKLFLFGVVGTWLQSIIRLVILMMAAYYWGEDAMWTAHPWTIYILFPLWYLLFVYIYFRQAGDIREKLKMKEA